MAEEGEFHEGLRMVSVDGVVVVVVDVGYIVHSAHLVVENEMVKEFAIGCSLLGIGRMALHVGVGTEVGLVQMLVASAVSDPESLVEEKVHVVQYFLFS